MFNQFRRRAKRIASGEKVDEKDLDAAAKQTAQDFEEFYADLYQKFKKSPRITGELAHYFVFCHNFHSPAKV